MSQIVIVGNGISGITAARHIRKQSDHNILVISGETDYFFSRTALMYIYMGHMKFEHTKPYEDFFWEKNRINLKNDWVLEIDTENKGLKLQSGESINYDQLILALGSKPRMLNWPGQELEGVSGLYSMQDLERIESLTRDCKKAVIVGGGLIGVELAEMLHSRNIDVTFLVRERNFWDVVLPEREAEMVNKEILRHGIDLRLESELKGIIGDEKGAVKAVMTDSGEEIEASFVGITVGVQANLSLMGGTEIERGNGILVDDFLETSVKDVFAIGDCVELRKFNEGRRAVEQVWYTGRMMGETVAQTICGNPTKYNPGVWFNSAKFFNMEYQTYGNVSANKRLDEEHFVWQSHDGNKLFRIVFEGNGRTVLGVNVLGMRTRHEVWDQWISEGRTVYEIMPQLAKANFDPEFSKRYEKEIIESFNKEFSNTIVQ